MLYSIVISAIHQNESAIVVYFLFLPNLLLNTPIRVLGEGNGTPLQCSGLESPRDGGAWWAAVYGAAQSWT